MIRNKSILLVFRLVVGGVFIWAGLLKILDPLEFAQNIANYRVFSRDLSLLAAIVLPWLEILCGVLVIFGIFRSASSLLLSSLLAAFLVLITVTIFRGLDVDCGCFGSLGRHVDYSLLLADIVLLYLTLSIFVSSLSRRSATS
ncbi:MAG: DoxX family membrane protein [Candidatus Aminicenantes bacterium]|nr:DoxX family membrane protein [Candidatus Aminicenantes bacterium]